MIPFLFYVNISLQKTTIFGIFLSAGRKHTLILPNQSGQGLLGTAKFDLYACGSSLLYFFPNMLDHSNLEQELSFPCKRQRRLSAEMEQGQGTARKRQVKSNAEKQNPYEAIPEIPCIKLTDDDMKSDPIELFMKLEDKYREFGAVKVTVSDRWRCPFQQRFVDKGITTRIQHLSKLKQGKQAPPFSSPDLNIQAFEQNVEAYSFHSYQSYALNFERTYRFKTQPIGKTPESKKEFEYWSLVTKPECLLKIILDEKSNVKVEYAADLASTKYGSGFPQYSQPKNKESIFSYETSLFNLNNIMNSPSSVLSMSAERKEKVSGITHPWVYMGCLFSTFCWHIEDLGVNSLNYNHKGAIKTWYLVPSSHKPHFEEYVKGKYCMSSHKQTLLNRITFMVDPLQLISIGIPVYKAYQRPRDFICTFFDAYHCGFSQGYNIGEAVNFMSPLSIDVMKRAQKEKKKNPKNGPNVIPIEWIVYENYERLAKFKKQAEKIENAYWDLIKKEKAELEQVRKIFHITSIVTYQATRKYDKIYCSCCKEYLYLRSYKVDNKTYCFEHLKREKEPASEATIYLRQPNEDRKYILTMLGEVPIDQETEDIDKKARPKSLPTFRTY